VRRAFVVPLVGLALMIPSLAAAAAGHRRDSGGSPVHLTQQLLQYSSSGAPPLTGSNSYVGTSDGRIGARAVHGTVRGTNTYTGAGNFSGKNTIYDAAGSIQITFTAVVSAPGQITGSGRFTGGTGRYRRAHGRFAFAATQTGPTTFTRVLNGRISFTR